MYLVYRYSQSKWGKPSCYIGMCGGRKEGKRTLKNRYNKPISPFNNEACRNKRRDEPGLDKIGTALAEKIWKLKNKGKTPAIKCPIADKAYPYKAGARLTTCVEQRRFTLRWKRKASANCPRTARC